MIRRKSFCVLGQKVKVEYSTEPIFDESGVRLVGSFDIKQNKIVIFEQDVDTDYKTLIHELVHAIINRGGLSQIITPDVEEIICELFSHFIYENFDLRKQRRR